MKLKQFINIYKILNKIHNIARIKEYMVLILVAKTSYCIVAGEANIYAHSSRVH